MSKKQKGHGIRYLAPSALMVLVTFIFTVTATFAWFTMSTTARVSGILFEVTGQDGLLIAVKQWKHFEYTATKTQANRIEVFKNQNDEYYYTADAEEIIIENMHIQNINSKYYIYTVQADGTDEIVNPAYVAAEGQNYYVYLTDSSDIGTVLDSKPFAVEHIAGSEYLLSGDILVEPEDSDFENENNMITESQLAKVCMNDKNADKITDSLTNATTRIDQDGYAISIRDLIEKDGSSFLPNSLTGGDRYTASFAAGTPATTAYKYEFDLYFMSASNSGVVLNTSKSSVRLSDSSPARRSVEAWDNLFIDNYTASQSVKNQYQLIGDGQWIPKGEKIYAESQNAIRVGISDSSGNPIAIWDPHPNQGWTNNDPSSNMALDFYNQATGSNLYRAPAKATLDSTTYLLNHMSQAQGNVYKGSIRVTVWLEGYDADCFDSIASQELKINLHFAPQSAIG